MQLNHRRTRHTNCRYISHLVVLPACEQSDLSSTPQEKRLLSGMPIVLRVASQR